MNIKVAPFALTQKLYYNTLLTWTTLAQNTSLFEMNWGYFSSREKMDLWTVLLISYHNTCFGSSKKTRLSETFLLNTLNIYFDRKAESNHFYVLYIKLSTMNSL